MSARDFVAGLWRWSIALATGDQPKNWRETAPENLGKKKSVCMSTCAQPWTCLSHAGQTLVHRPDGGARVFFFATAGTWNAAPLSKVPRKPFWAMWEMIPHLEKLSCIDSSQSAAVYRSPRCSGRKIVRSRCPQLSDPYWGLQ